MTDKNLVHIPQNELSEPERRFPNATANVVRFSIDLALAGFERLQKHGYPVDHASALELVQVLFRLRGAQKLWELYFVTKRNCCCPALFEPCISYPHKSSKSIMYFL